MYVWGRPPLLPHEGYYASRSTHNDAARPPSTDSSRSVYGPQLSRTYPVPTSTRVRDGRRDGPLPPESVASDISIASVGGTRWGRKRPRNEGEAEDAASVRKRVRASPPQSGKTQKHPHHCPRKRKHANDPATAAAADDDDDDDDPTFVNSPKRKTTAGAGPSDATPPPPQNDDNTDYTDWNKMHNNLNNVLRKQGMKDKVFQHLVANWLPTEGHIPVAALLKYTAAVRLTINNIKAGLGMFRLLTQWLAGFAARARQVPGALKSVIGFLVRADCVPNEITGEMYANVMAYHMKAMGRDAKMKSGLFAADSDAVPSSATNFILACIKDTLKKYAASLFSQAFVITTPADEDNQFVFDTVSDDVLDDLQAKLDNNDGKENDNGQNGERFEYTTTSEVESDDDIDGVSDTAPDGINTDLPTNTNTNTDYATPAPTPPPSTPPQATDPACATPEPVAPVDTVPATVVRFRPAEVDDAVGEAPTAPTAPQTPTGGGSVHTAKAPRIPTPDAADGAMCDSADKPEASGERVELPADAIVVPSSAPPDKPDVTQQPVMDDAAPAVAAAAHLHVANGAVPLTPSTPKPSPTPTVVEPTVMEGRGTTATATTPQREAAADVLTTPTSPNIAPVPSVNNPFAGLGSSVGKMLQSSLNELTEEALSKNVVNTVQLSDGDDYSNGSTSLDNSDYDSDESARSLRPSDILDILQVNGKHSKVVLQRGAQSARGMGRGRGARARGSFRGRK